MAEVNPPGWLDVGSYSARIDRRVLQSLVPVGGVAESGELAVTANGTPNMSVNVAAGTGFVVGTEQTRQGTYHVYNDATKNLAIATADGTNPRRDLVVAKVQDSSVSGATDLWSLAVVAGTPAASPADPPAPVNSITLARVTVPAAASSIVAGNITDLRNILATSETYNNARHKAAHGAVWDIGTNAALALTTAYQDIPGLTKTITVPRTGMLWVVNATVVYVATASGYGWARTRCLVDGVELLGGWPVMHENATGGTHPGLWFHDTLTVGSHTIKLQAVKDVNAGTVTVRGTESVISVVGYG